ncbi:MAG: aminotransferase class I/II-fold pyridoxal phosphate-dependent enzyme, partial [Infirmifilum sp.]
MPRLSSRTQAIVGSPIRRIATLLDEARRKGDIISFGGGAPSLPPPQEVVDYLADFLRKAPQKTVAYGATRGMIELRELIAEDLKKYWNVSYDPKEEIMIVNGGTEGIYLALGAILEP